MIQELYNYLSVTFGSIACIFGLCFLLLSGPHIPALQNYRLMRNTLAIAYIIVGLLSILELATQEQYGGVYLPLLVTISVASFQAFLFTYTLITLIDTNFIRTKRLYIEAGIILFFSILCFSLYFSRSEKLFFIAFSVYTLYYFFQLLRYTYMFIIHFKAYKGKMDNYFSEQESDRLRWVVFAFFSALGIGAIAFLMIFIPLWAVVYGQAIMILYYSFFGIRLINYAFRFQDIEAAISQAPEPEILIMPLKYDQLEPAVDDWVKTKKFVESGITIDEMANHLRTNRTYLSTYINSQKNKTFKSWISELRINEAKRILLEDISMPVGDVGALVGIPDKSNFGRLFTRIEGHSPQVWRKSNGHSSRTGS